jgi:hypothetical protein
LYRTFFVDEMTNDAIRLPRFHQEPGPEHFEAALVAW